jgi:hypothetical protein
MTKAFKGFNPDLTCRGFQFVEGETFTIDTDPELCERGFHATLAPIDVLRYYPPASSVYHEVEVEDHVARWKITSARTTAIRRSQPAPSRSVPDSNSRH